jgi:Phytanoyl-CoA dioxygenase (PhyH)
MPEQLSLARPRQVRLCLSIIGRMDASDTAAKHSGGQFDGTSVFSMNTPWVESVFFQRELAARASHLTNEQQEFARLFRDQGFVAAPQAVPVELCDRVRQQAEPLFHDDAAISSRRVKNAWRKGSDAARELAVFTPIQELLHMLYERRPIPFQTLDFKWGTEQRGHADSIHFSCLPARFMCGVWVALEDVDDSNGPLFYYPGSHRLPEFTGYDLGYSVGDYSYQRYEDFQHDLMDELGIEPIEFHAAKGDLLIWASNVIHGGAPVRRQGSTRWSQVTHYFFDGCTYYQPYTSEIPTGELRLLDIVDLNTMQPVPPTYNGQAIRVRKKAHGRSRISVYRKPPPATEQMRHFGSTCKQVLARRLGR